MQNIVFIVFGSKNHLAVFFVLHAQQKSCHFSTGLSQTTFSANIYLFKVNNRDTRKRYQICSKLTVKTPEQRL